MLKYHFKRNINSSKGLTFCDVFLVTISCTKGLQIFLLSTLKYINYYIRVFIKQMVLLVDLTAWLQGRILCDSNWTERPAILSIYQRQWRILSPNSLWWNATIFQEINLFCFSTTFTLTLRIIRKMKYYESSQKFSFLQNFKNIWNVVKYK